MQRLTRTSSTWRCTKGRSRQPPGSDSQACHQASCRRGTQLGRRLSCWQQIQTPSYWRMQRRLDTCCKTEHNGRGTSTPHTLPQSYTSDSSRTLMAPVETKPNIERSCRHSCSWCGCCQWFELHCRSCSWSCFQSCYQLTEHELCTWKRPSRDDVVHCCHEQWPWCGCSNHGCSGSR